MALQPVVGPWLPFQFLHLFTQSVGLLGRGISPSQSPYLHTGQNKRTETFMRQVGFVIQRTKKVHDFGLTATVIGEPVKTRSLIWKHNPSPILTTQYRKTHLANYLNLW
jgi:hypothetical protein